jgi:hypothetical protein
MIFQLNVGITIEGKIMKKFLYLIFFSLLLSVNAYAENITIKCVDKKRGVMRCAQAVIKNSPQKKYSKKMKLSSI